MVYDTLGEKLSSHAGIRLHTGKTRVWNRAGVCPEEMTELGPDVWNPEGVKVLGTTLGSRKFVEHIVQERLEEENKLWEAIPSVPDLQAAWQNFLHCAGPRCHHMLRTLPPFFLWKKEGHSVTTKLNPHRGSWSASDGTSPAVTHIVSCDTGSMWQKIWHTLCSAFVSNGAPK